MTDAETSRDFVLPGDVISPRDRWKLLKVMDDGDNQPHTLVYAIGLWDKKLSLAVRWTGSSENPLGHPSVFNQATWFMLDESLANLVIESRGWTFEIMRACRKSDPE